MSPKPMRSVFSVFFEYDTPRIVHIQSKKVGVINRFIQLAIIAYVIGFAIVYKKGYQEFDDVQSSVTTKVKGVVFTNLTGVTGIGSRIWDVADYVIPSQENGAFFVTTNVIVTPNQTQSTCDEDPTMPGILCTKDSDCPEGEPVVTGNGVRTGFCVNSTQNTTVKVCEIYAWCPVENPADPTLPKEPVLKDSKGFTVFLKNNIEFPKFSVKRPKEPVLKDSKGFTVFLKNNIEFPKFSVKRRNLPSQANDSYLQSCRYNSVTDTSCPIFLLGTIVEESGNQFEEMAAKDLFKRLWKLVNKHNIRPGISFITERLTFGRNILGVLSDEELKSCRYDPEHPKSKFCPIFVLENITALAGQDYGEMSVKGGVVEIIIRWDCNLDYNLENCVPEYEFRRLDSSDYAISKGYNFRYANFYREDNSPRRTLYKAYGILFIVNVMGRAGKFNVVPLLMNIGSGLALLSVATIICDIVVLYVLKARKMYKEKKYLNVKGDDAYEILDDEPPEKDGPRKRRSIQDNLANASNSSLAQGD